MSKKLFWMQRCAVVLPLLIAVSAFGADTTYFFDDFESYTAGAPPTANWVDWTSGAVPATGNTVLATGGIGNSQQYQLGNAYAGAESVVRFANPFDVNNREVVTTFQIKGDPGVQGVGASWFQVFQGSMGVPPGTGSPTLQYGTNIGELSINGDWSTAGSGGTLTPLQFAGAAFQYNPIMKDGVTWNTVQINSIARNVSGTGILGESQLTVSYVDPVTTLTQTYVSPWASWSLAAEGMTGLDLYSTSSPATWYLDNYGIVQKETLAAPPSNFPTPDTMLPGTKGLKGGGITREGKYLYATGGDSTGGAMYRYDVLADTWTTLTARPTVRIQTELVGGVPTAVTHNDTNEAHGLSVDANGKIVVMAGDTFPTGNNAYVYDIATDTWAPVVVGHPGKLEPPQAGVTTYELPVCAEAVGTSTYGCIVPGQAGLTEFDTTTNLYITGQGTGPTMPNNVSWGADMAAVGTNIYGLNGKNDATSTNGELHVLDTTTGTWAADGTLADMPVPVSATQNALTYLDPALASIVVMHGDWGLGGLYEIKIAAGGAGSLIAAVQGTSDLYQYDIATDTWTTLTGVLSFTFADGDDICEGARLWGDANLDGAVDLLDLGDMANNWGTGTTWATGDLNGDGNVDLLDLGLMAGGWGNGLQGVGSGTIPEPMTMTLFGFGALALLRRRRK